MCVLQVRQVGDFVWVAKEICISKSFKHEAGKERKELEAVLCHVNAFIQSHLSSI